jgi:FkbM family methyltransferase
MANREVLEIGANIGTTTIPLVTALGASRVYAFEPVAANYRLLRLNVIANDLASRVDTHQSAVSDRVGTLHFVASARNAGSSHVASDDEAGHEVPCVTVDDLVSRGVVAGDRLGLVWIDVEGHEASVLAGADSLVAVPTVLEYQPRLHANMDRLNELIARRRGHVFDLASGAEVSMHTLAEGDQTRATDLLLLPQH